MQVNGENVSTKKFVKEFIGNSLAGMVESLHIKDPIIRKVNLEIEYE